MLVLGFSSLAGSEAKAFREVSKGKRSAMSSEVQAAGV